MRIAVALAAFLALGSTAYARDCSGPPYGATWSGYEAFKVTKLLDNPETVLQKICTGRDIPGAERNTLLRLGFTQQEIADTDTVELAVKVIRRLRDVMTGKE